MVYPISGGLAELFYQWCIYRAGWWWSWDLSWISCTFIGSMQTHDKKVQAWSEPLFNAFCAGAWLLYWTNDTLFWISKPTLHKDSDSRRLHNSIGPAMECDIENLYFWHGVLVPAFVVTHPDWITIKHIESETNAEVRRVMIERYGLARYLQDSHSIEIARDSYGVLFKKEVSGDETIMAVHVLNSTSEPDGPYTRDEAIAIFSADTLVHSDGAMIPVRNMRPSARFKDAFLRVPPTITRAKEGVAWTFGKTEAEYCPIMET